jgi:hypothetical protein
VVGVGDRHRAEGAAGAALSSIILYLPSTSVVLIGTSPLYWLLPTPTTVCSMSALSCGVVMATGADINWAGACAVAWAIMSVAATVPATSSCVWCFMSSSEGQW